LMGAPDAATTAERSTSVSTTMPRSACRRAARTLGRQGRLLQPGHGFRSGAPQPDQVHRRRSASERAGCRALTSRDTGKAARCGVLSPTPFRALAGPGPPAAGGCARVRCWPRQPAKQPAWIPRSRRAADLAADDRARAGGHRARVLRVGHMVGEPAVGVQELAACAALLVIDTAHRQFPRTERGVLCGVGHIAGRRGPGTGCLRGAPGRWHGASGGFPAAGASRRGCRRQAGRGAQPGGRSTPRAHMLIRSYPSSHRSLNL